MSWNVSVTVFPLLLFIAKLMLTLNVLSYCIIALAFYVYPDDADGFGDAVNRFFAPHP